MSGQLLGNVLAFGRVLRGLGLDAGPDRMLDLVHALDHVPLSSRRDVAHAARALCVRRREEIARFDAAFEAFWRKPREGETTLDLRSLGERRRFRRPAFSPAPAPSAALSAEDRGQMPGATPPALSLTLTYSPQEVLRRRDFGELSSDELGAVERAI